eukprot:gnl/MRDRNA2_/MRDRNA2_76012_c0_seq1.p1 gnl/MRDRNA2_/MRDRNA2_76012_c0~~gnl/MRDRNA2_/MRDRNA2_76012_c0_seq1.p1  ORF type:complete len:612 (+),score=99.61 gnl/MRDRNA2_/MRDRNA2_76012_c0_seq1:2-1837(+)
MSAADVEKMSASEMRALISSASMSYSDCLEKTELRSRALEAVARLASRPAPTPASSKMPRVGPVNVSAADLDTMSIHELRKLIVFSGLSTTGLTERSELKQRALEALAKGPRPLHVPSLTLLHKAKTTLDEYGYKREFLYSTDGKPKATAPVVDCANWDNANETQQLNLLEEVLAKLTESGYVILDSLLPKEGIKRAFDEWRRIRDRCIKNGMSFDRIRGGREFTVPPCSGVFAEDWLTRHPFVLKIIAHYVRNSVNAIDDEEGRRQLQHWQLMGAPMDLFQKGQLGSGRPYMDLQIVIDTPSGPTNQNRHRDTPGPPGPAASIGVHIPLTPLQLEPLNAALGYTPGSHRVPDMSRGHPKIDVVGVAPPGSVILFDSYLDHHGMENDSDQPRAALFSWYRTPGVWTLDNALNYYGESHKFAGLKETMRWRRHVEEKLRPTVFAARPEASNGAEVHPGFPYDREIADWSTDRICFRCDRTNDQGAFRNGMWFCNRCWVESRERGGPEAAPEPLPWNAVAPEYKSDDFNEERQRELEMQSVLKAFKGRHKLALLRERGHFLPVDPTSAWLKKIDRDPQPEQWKGFMAKSWNHEGRTQDDPYRPGYVGAKPRDR